MYASDLNPRPGGVLALDSDTSISVASEVDLTCLTIGQASRLTATITVTVTTGRSTGLICLGAAAQRSIAILPAARLGTLELQSAPTAPDPYGPPTSFTLVYSRTSRDATAIGTQTGTATVRITYQDDSAKSQHTDVHLAFSADFAHADTKTWLVHDGYT